MKLPYQALLLSTAALLSACGGGDKGGTDTPPDSPALSVTTIDGRLFAPDGETPISNALVYLENSTRSGSELAQKTAATEVSCGSLPDRNWAYSCTDADGRYIITASIPSAGAKLIAKKGAFTAELMVVPQSASIRPDPLLIATSGANAARMAVVTGNYDRVQDLLAKLGFGVADPAGTLILGTEKFDLFDGDDTLNSNYPEVESLLADADKDGRPDIYNYAIVFFNCGFREIDYTAADIETLRNYVAAGGRIYVSDLSYDLVEQAFPEYIDFQGSDSVDPSQPEFRDAAELGIGGLEVQADVDPAMAAWLKTVGCVNGECLDSEGRALIGGFLDSWAVMVGAHPGAPSQVRVWVRGPITFRGGSSPVVRPLTASFNHGAGRVSFTSYHTEPEFNVPGGFVAAERVLQFLVFEL